MVHEEAGQGQKSKRGPRFCSQQPGSSSQLSLTPGPGDLTHSSSFVWHGAFMWFTDIHACKTPTYVKNKEEKGMLILTSLDFCVFVGLFLRYMRRKGRHELRGEHGSI